MTSSNAAFRLLLVTQYWPPEYGPDQAILLENMTYLQQQGIDVTVIAALPSYPTGIVPPAYRNRLLLREEIGCIRTLRTWTYSGDRNSMKNRVLNEASFAISSLLGWLALRERFDLVLVLTPPQEITLPGWIIALLSRARYALYVMDLMPEVAISLGMIKNPRAIAALRAIAGFCYRRCSVVVAASDVFKSGVEAYGIPPNRVACVPNGIDTHLFRPVPPDPVLREHFDLGDRFVAIFAGTHGHSHDLDSIVEVAETLQREGDATIALLLVGDGSDKRRIIAEVERRKLRNIHFHDPVARERLPAVLAAADAILVPFRRLAINVGVIPIKMYDGMACARPIVLAIEGEARDILSDAGAGVAVDPEQPTQLLAAIRSIQSDPARALTLGENGRHYVEQHFSREHCAGLLLTALRQSLEA